MKFYKSEIKSSIGQKTFPGRNTYTHVYFYIQDYLEENDIAGYNIYCTKSQKLNCREMIKLTE